MKNKIIFIGKNIFFGLLLWVFVIFWFEGIKSDRTLQVICIIAAILFVITIFKNILNHIKEIKERKTDNLVLGKYTFIIGYIISVAVAVILYILIGNIY